MSKILLNRRSEPVRAIREKLLTLLLKIFAIAGTVTYIPSAYLAVREELWAVFAGDTVALLYVIGMVLIPGASFRLKAISLIFAMYCLGVLLLLFTGPFGAGHLFLFCFVCFTALFGNRAQLIGANVLSGITLCLFMVGVLTRTLPWVQGIDSVLVVSINFILLSIVLSFAVNYLVLGYAVNATEETKLRKMLEAMLMEIEHRVKNNLQLISSLISMRSRSPANAAQALEDIKESLSAITVVHQILYRQDALYVVKVNSLLDALVERFGMVHKSILFSYEWTGAEAEVDSDTAVSLGILITEIVVNSAKHAFPAGHDAKVAIKVDFDAATRNMTLTICDNGRGMDDDKPPVEGHGSKIIRALAKQIGAEVSTASGKGLGADAEGAGAAKPDSPATVAEAAADTAAVENVATPAKLQDFPGLSHTIVMHVEDPSEQAKGSAFAV